MATDQPAHYPLDDEQRAQVRDCLTKEGLALPQDRFEPLILGIEASIEHFRKVPAKGTFREAHDALSAFSRRCHLDPAPVRVLRDELAKLPNAAIEYIARRSRVVIPGLFPGETIGDDVFDPPERLVARFLAWVNSADDQKLVAALRILSQEGRLIVEGRSRGAGKRSHRRVEPMIMGEVRGADSTVDRGGRPQNSDNQDLVMRLAGNWHSATGEVPKPRRSDSTGFGDLVHGAFQWLGLPEGSAAYASRRYWADVKRGKAREPLEDFLKRWGEEL
jgi:hypothetical protein